VNNGSVLSRKRTTAMLASAFVVVALSSCGSSSSKTNASSSATTASPAASAPSTTTTTAAAAGDVTADTAKAKQINLQLSDLPSGWTSSPASPKSAQDQADDVKTASCLGIPPPSQTHTVDIDSDDFSSGNLSISSNVTFARTADAARQELAAYSGSKVTSCLTQSLQDSMARDANGATVSNLSVTPATKPSGGDGGFAYHVTATVMAQGQQVQLTVDVLAVLVGRAELNVSSFGIGNQTVPDQTLRSLMAKMVARAS